jgi:hypothetical protein
VGNSWISRDVLCELPASEANFVVGSFVHDRKMSLWVIIMSYQQSLNSPAVEIRVEVLHVRFRLLTPSIRPYEQ